MSKIRVIAGSAKGRRLDNVPGPGTRPIMDRVKESLFNIIGMDIIKSSFLDLFSGTGSVGIESLSRGASSCRFNDNSSRAIKTIKLNLAATKLSHLAKVTQLDAFKLLKAANLGPFDYIYVAPPQYKGYWEESLHLIDARMDFLTSDGWVIVQIDPLEYKEISLKQISEFDQRQYGNTLLVFYEKIISENHLATNDAC